MEPMVTTQLIKEAAEAPVRVAPFLKKSKTIMLSFIRKA